MQIHPTQRPVNVLLIVGDLNEIRQIRHTLQQAKVKNPLHHVGDVTEARAYLRQEGPYEHAASPGLVLLDASLPQKSGLDLLAELKTDEKFAGIPVIVIAGSESESGLFESCMYAADACIQKPLSLTELVQVLASIDTLSFLLMQSVPAI